MNYTTTLPTSMNFYVKDPISALTHLIGLIAAIIGLPVLLLHGAVHQLSLSGLISLSVFMLSMIFLYAASTTYHTFDLSQQSNKILKKIDHMMIFVLIAGSYTPLCLIALSFKSGLRLLILVWSIALIGILFKAFWVTCPKWVSSVIYIGMGWLCVTAIREIMATLPRISWIWLLIGGIIYTIGGIVYALKMSFLQKYCKNFGAHELFHVFVLIGSFCHYMAMMYIA